MIPRTTLVRVVCTAGALCIGPLAQAQVYYNDTFDAPAAVSAGISASRSGTGAVESVQGYSVLAPLFEGSFLRNTSPGDPAPASVFRLDGLPPGEQVLVRFSLAIIDSWDGSFFPPSPIQSPDFLNVAANGTSVFRESFTNLSFLEATQTYQGSALIVEEPLGFETGTFRVDSAYRIGVVTSADANGSLSLSFFADGSGWLGGIPTGAGPEEESWAIDTLTVRAYCVADLTTTGATLSTQTGFGEPDGVADLDDLGYYLNFWLLSAAEADLTTTGATLEGLPGFGLPDGVTDLDDLGYFLNFWLAGCP